MPPLTHDLVIQLDEAGEKLIFSTARRGAKATPHDAPAFSVEITLQEIRDRGEEGGERLIGESVLGFFDHLTDGRLDLPKRYRDG